VLQTPNRCCLGAKLALISHLSKKTREKIAFLVAPNVIISHFKTLLFGKIEKTS
jgi:hypothetical protein